MENKTRNSMVDNSNLAYKFQEVEKEIDYTYLPDQLKYTSVSLTEVFNNKLRLEASSFSIEAKFAVEKLKNCRNGVSNFHPNESFVVDAYHAPRFKRNYISETVPNSVGFLGSAEMLNVKAKAIKFITKNQAEQKNLFVKKGTVLISCSGTIGKTTFVNKSLEKFAFSQHIIRLICKEYSGYVYTFLNTPEAQAQIQSLIYGAVIPEIEPHHLEKVIIPNAPNSLKKEIHELIVDSYDLRDESNDLIDKAESILYEELQLKPIEELKTEYFDNSVELRNYTTKLSDLRLRFDGSFHIPIVKQVESALKLNAKELIKLSDLSLTNDIVLPGRFSRTYVDKENGVQFLGGRDLFQLSPTTEKYLSKVVHKKQIEGDLKISKNDILTPSRGTIGKVVLAPEHFSDKAISDNIINIRPANENIAGYLFSILNSEYGSILIKRQIYGGVVDAMEPAMLSSIDIPLLKNEKKQKEINDLVLQANELRYQAHLKEQEAIKKMENIINDTK
jgi:type I restriction enzyme S subunit